MSIPHRKFEVGSRGSIVVLGPNGILQADSFHPHYRAIVDAVERGDEIVYSLFDVKKGLGRRLEALSDRVSYNGTDICFDGTPVHSVLADQIKRALESGESDYNPLVRFWEKLEANPQAHSKEQAYRWLATHDFKITEDGDVVAYKGVQDNRDGTFSSTGRSDVPDVPSGYVDGEPVKPLSVITKKVGSVVTMPRAEVAHDPNQACHRGLHVGDWSYANNFAKGAVLEVHVHPRDIVSVPTGDRDRKVRCCKYKVVSVVTAEYTGGPVLRPASVAPSWDDVGYSGY